MMKESLSDSSDTISESWSSSLENITQASEKFKADMSKGFDDMFLEKPAAIQRTNTNFKELFDSLS